MLQQLHDEIKDRCGDLLVEANLGTKILKPSEWKHSIFFKIKSGSWVWPTYHPTEISYSNIEKITSKAEIHLKREAKNVVLSEFFS